MKKKQSCDKINLQVVSRKKYEIGGGFASDLFWCIMIEIIDKTKDYVIIYKPPGIPSQADPSGDKDAMTLCAEQFRALDEPGSLFLIHRLDRVVGGLIVFARNKKTGRIHAYVGDDFDSVKQELAEDGFEAKEI